VDVITVDFETYYSKTFGFRKLTTEQYVRSPDFEVIGVAVKVNDGDAEWNGSGGNYIYIAIRASNIPTITYDPDLQWPGGTAPTAPAAGETDVLTFNTTDGGTSYKAVVAIDGAS